MNTEGKMTFLEHLEELRKRLFYCLGAVLVGMVICWIFREDIRVFLESPLYEAWRNVDGLPEPEPLKFTSLLGPFVMYLKLSALGGLFLASPVVLLNIWRFVAPGLYPKEKKVAFPFVVVSTLLFAGGAIMSYSIVMPIGFTFFLQFAAGGEVTLYETTATTLPSATQPPPANPPQLKQKVTKATPHKQQHQDTETDAGKMKPEQSGNPGIDGGIQEKDNPKETAVLPIKQKPANTGKPASQKPDIPKKAVKQSVNTKKPTAKITSPHNKKEVTSNKPNTNKPISKEPRATFKNENRQVAWYDWILQKIVGVDCGQFTAGNFDGKTVPLTFSWIENRCGNPPQLVSLLRNGIEQNIEFKTLQKDQDSPASNTGIITFIGMDSPTRLQKRYAYTLKTISIPKDAGKLMPMLMVQEYLSVAMRLLLAFGIVFELPVLITFLSIAGIVNYRQLLRFSRWFIVLSVVFAAILTPPDVITQVLLAMPLIILYFVSVGIAFILGPKPDDEPPDDED